MPRIREAVAGFRALIQDYRNSGIADKEIATAMLLAFEADPAKRILQANPQMAQRLGEMANAIKTLLTMSQDLFDSGRFKKTDSSG